MMVFDKALGCCKLMEKGVGEEGEEWSERAMKKARYQEELCQPEKTKALSSLSAITTLHASYLYASSWC
jgi:hypothetical protein